MKKLKYLLLIFILFISPNVFAQDFNVETSKITSPEGQGRTGTYSGLEIYNGGSPAVYNIGTRYNGRLSRIWFNLIAGGYADPDGFEKGHTYTLSMNMATQDWRNGFGSVSVKCEGSSGQELSNGRVTFVSMYKIKFSFTAPTDRFCQFVYIDLKSSNINSTYITGTNNWNLSSMVISDPAYDSSGGGSGGSGGTGGTTDPNQSIIDNANQNTTSIINNQNSNTTDIIDNANQNTDRIIESNKVCKIYDYNIDNVEKFDGYLTYSGSIVDGGVWFKHTGYIPINKDVDYTLTTNFTNNNLSYCLYKDDKSLINCQRYSSQSFTINSSEDGFIRYSTRNTYVVNFTGKYCQNGQQATTDAINDVNNTLNNDNVDSDVGTGFFDDFQDNSHGLTSIITAPLNAIQSITNSTCQPLSVPIPFTNSSVSLPCMSQVYEQNIPTIYNIWKIVSFGIIAYFICIDIFHIVKGFKDPESDKVEVLDL